jgi:hypothetical protein
MRWIPGFLALVLMVVGCTSTNDFLQEVGSTRIVQAAPNLAPQSLDDPDRIQVAQWTVNNACLDLDGTLVDLVNLSAGCDGEDTEPCEMTDTSQILPFSNSRCAGGLVIGANAEDPVDVALDVVFTMTVRRARPPDLPDGSDYDGDEVANEADNCPLVFNEDQRDDNMDGIGDACSVSDGAGGFLLDSDADGVPDTADNCVWEYNPGQENTTGVAAEGINDGIGDACTEQIANVVDSSGQSEITVMLGPVPLLQQRGRLSYVTVDMDDALDCGDWSGDCRLDVARIRLCVRTDLASAGAGCP